MTTLNEAIARNRRRANTRLRIAGTRAADALDCGAAWRAAYRAARKNGADTVSAIAAADAACQITRLA